MTAPYPVSIFIDGRRAGSARLHSITMNGEVMTADPDADTFIGYNAEASFTVETSIRVTSPRSSFLALMEAALRADAARAGNTRRGRRLARQAAKVARAQKRAEAEEATP